MLNNNNDFICYKYRISSYIIQISIISVMILLFFSLNNNNPTIFAQKLHSQFTEHDNINIVAAGIIIAMMKQKTPSKILFLLIQN